jgi:uracil-DNA glycosylase family 4
MDKTSGARARSKPLVETLLAKPVRQIPTGNLAALRRKARDCHACGLWKHATQTIFGAGADDARIMLIGEQPGSQEDAQGLPFVGPAGGLLDRALEDAHVDRSTLYLTNTVKHFKYELRGKLRLHKRATAAGQEACRMWQAEEEQVGIVRSRGHPQCSIGRTAGIEKGIADADKKARTGSTDEPVRNTPPAGPWNDTVSD